MSQLDPNLELRVEYQMQSNFHNNQLYHIILQ